MRGILATVVAVAILAGAFVLIRNGAFDAKPTPSATATASATPTATLVETTSPGPSTSVAVTPTSVPSPTATPSATPSPTPIDTSVVAAAVVVPIRSADLATRVSGIVDATYVREGGEALAGQLLLRLDQSTYLVAIDVAQSAVGLATVAVEQAQLQVDQLPPDASPSQIETAQANLRLAQAQLELARSNLTAAQNNLLQTEVRAPFAGTIADVAVEVGEQAIAGQTAITMGDLSSWLIETTDLSDLEVVRVHLGDRATVTFEALPGLVMPGTVDRIQVRGTSAGGGIVFAVSVRPDATEPDLRWGMTATVRIAPSQ